MLETIKEFVAQYLPAITSVGSTLVAVIAFFANMKKILEKKDDERKNLLEQIKELNTVFNDVTLKNTLSTEKLEAELEEVKEVNKKLTEYVSTAKEELKELKVENKTLTTIKEQLSEELRQARGE